MLYILQYKKNVLVIKEKFLTTVKIALGVVLFVIFTSCKSMFHHTREFANCETFLLGGWVRGIAVHHGYYICCLLYTSRCV